MPYLSFQNVSYAIDGRTVLDGISFDVERGETLVLLGRSGSGKTTALRLMNRMLDPSAGHIYLDGEDVGSLDAIALRRRIGYVIQEFGLLPHWTVQRNVELIPQLLGWPEEKRRQRARELLSQVGLDPVEIGARHPAELSGGQRQRVAVARALAADPLLLLFDEPFGALDPVTRHEMQQQFLDLRRHFQIAAVFVTHDILEALSVGTKIALLHDGKLEAITTPEEFRSLGTPVARAFLNTLPAEIARDARV